MYCTLCKLYGGSTPFAKEGTDNFKRTAIADHGSCKQHTASIENSCLKKNLERMREKMLLKTQLKQAILIRIVGFISRNDLSLDKYKNFCSFIEDVINLVVPGDTKFTLLEETYLSWYGCLKFLESLNNTIMEKENLAMSKSTMLSLMLDESTDNSQEKNLVVFSKFVDPESFEIRTMFMGLLNLEGLDSISIFNSIIGFLETRRVNLNKIAAIASDGASVMRGKDNGVIARFKKTIKRGIIDVHCASHCLALMMSKSTKVNGFMKKFDASLRDIFFYYRKFYNRKDLEKLQAEQKISKRRLKQSKEIRWFSRFEVVEVVHANLVVILNDLSSKSDPELEYQEERFSNTHGPNSYPLDNNTHNTQVVKREKSEVSQAEAKLLLSQIGTLDFILTLHIVLDLLKEVQVVTKMLQSQDLRIFDVEPHLTSLYSKIEVAYVKSAGFGVEYKKLREDISYRTALTKIADFEIDYIHSQTVQQNIQLMCEKMLDYFHKYFPSTAIWRALQIFNLSKLFNTCVEGVDEKNRVIINSSIAVYGVESLDLIIDHLYRNDDSVQVKIQSIKEEWSNLKYILCNDFFSVKQPADRIFKLLRENVGYRNAFKNILEVFELSLIVPTGSVECERGFSKQNLLKTPLRNRLGKGSFKLS